MWATQQSQAEKEAEARLAEQPPKSHDTANGGAATATAAEGEAGPVTSAKKPRKCVQPPEGLTIVADTVSEKVAGDCWLRRFYRYLASLDETFLKKKPSLEEIRLDIVRRLRLQAETRSGQWDGKIWCTATKQEIKYNKGYTEYLTEMAKSGARWGALEAMEFSQRYKVPVSLTTSSGIYVWGLKYADEKVKGKTKPWFHALCDDSGAEPHVQELQGELIDKTLLRRAAQDVSKGLRAGAKGSEISKRSSRKSCRSESSAGIWRSSAASQSSAGIWDHSTIGAPTAATWATSTSCGRGCGSIQAKTMPATIKQRSALKSKNIPSNTKLVIDARHKGKRFYDTDDTMNGDNAQPLRMLRGPIKAEFDLNGAADMARPLEYQPRHAKRPVIKDNEYDGWECHICKPSFRTVGPRWREQMWKHAREQHPIENAKGEFSFRQARIFGEVGDFDPDKHTSVTWRCPSRKCTGVINGVRADTRLAFRAKARHWRDQHPELAWSKFTSKVKFQRSYQKREANRQERLEAAMMENNHRISSFVVQRKRKSRMVFEEQAQLRLFCCSMCGRVSHTRKHARKTNASLIISSTEPLKMPCTAVKGQQLTTIARYITNTIQLLKRYNQGNNEWQRWKELIKSNLPYFDLMPKTKLKLQRLLAQC